MERTCKKCGETKPIDKFVKSKGCSEGYCFTCRLCYNSHARQIVNKETRAEKNKQYKVSHKEYFKQYGIQYYKLHKIKFYHQRRKWIENNREKYKEMCNKSSISLKHKLQKRKCSKKAIDSLLDSYIIERLHDIIKIDFKVIKQYPELIENYRQQMRVKRLLKSRKDENIKTS